MKAKTGAVLAELARRHEDELDAAIAAWRQGAGADVRLWCGAGCGNCCTLAVNATLPEALAIAGILDAGRRERLAAAAERIAAHAQQSTDTRQFLAGYRRAVGSCPFLDDNADCSIYAARPLACRALLATRPPDWCGVNLAELPDCERTAFLAGLDRSVAAFPTHYAAAPQQLAAAAERGLIIAMIRTAGVGVTGNLVLLAWLAGQPGFAEALAGGPAAFTAYLDGQRANRPFLMQFHHP